MVSALDELVDESGIRPLSDGEQARINDLLDGDVYNLTESVKAKATVRRASTTVLAATAPTVNTAALTDTQPITLDAPTGETPVPPKKTGDMPVPPVPGTQRRSFAEIDLDTQPPTPRALPKKPIAVATLADLLVALLSRPAWLAGLGVLALLSFLSVNLLVWSSVKQPAKIEETPPSSALDTPETPMLHPSEHKTPTPFLLGRNLGKTAGQLRILSARTNNPP